MSYSICLPVHLFVFFKLTKNIYSVSVNRHFYVFLSQGCPCHTFEYGCCPDGESIARGPAQEGCTCKDREFGCCPDRRTPSQVPHTYTLALQLFKTVAMSCLGFSANLRNKFCGCSIVFLRGLGRKQFLRRQNSHYKQLTFCPNCP